MIITLTPNPCVDQTAWVEQIEPGRVHRVVESHLDPAGKGINASRMIHRMGFPTIAFGFLAGETGNLVEKALDTEGVQHHFIPIPGQTRINTTVVERATGRATSFYGPGPAVTPEAVTALETMLEFWFQAGRVLVLAGSLLPGFEESFYAEYIRAARKAGLKVILDADQVPLELGIAAGPHLIKPNVAEAERLLGRTLPDRAAVIGAAHELTQRGIEVVVISMGAQGSICASGERTWHVHSPPVERRSTVGSGDSMVAGLAVMFAKGAALEDGLRLGTAAGAATAMTPGTAQGSAERIRELMPQVRVERVR